MSRRAIGAVGGIAGLVLLIAAAYYFLFSPRRLMRIGPDVTRTGSSEGKPSPTQGPVQAPAPKEHALPPPPAELPPAPPQTPESLEAMVRSLAGQPNGSVVRVVNVMHDGGHGCHGVLVFLLDEFRFECPTDAGESFRISRIEVGQLHRNGVQVWKPGRGKKLGRKYHFSMVGREKDLVQGTFAEWMKLCAN